MSSSCLVLSETRTMLKRSLVGGGGGGGDYQKCPRASVYIRVDAMEVKMCCDEEMSFWFVLK